MLQELLKYAQTEETKQWVSTVVKNYKKKHPLNLSEVEHILDYLHSDKAPKRIDRMSYAEAKSNTDKWVKSLTKKGKNIIETEEDVKVFHSFKDGFRIVELVSEDSYRREGHLMRHCVGSYYSRKDCHIYSLRDAQNQPHCTIEVLKYGEEIKQIKGKGNGLIHPKYIKHVLKFLKKIGLKVRASEMINLGYFAPDKKALAQLNKYFTNWKNHYVSVNGGYYLYTPLFQQNIKLKKEYR